jgi:hypothetical protein
MKLAKADNAYCELQKLDEWKKVLKKFYKESSKDNSYELQQVIHKSYMKHYNKFLLPKPYAWQYPHIKALVFDDMSVTPYSGTIPYSVFNKLKEMESDIVKIRYEGFVAPDMKLHRYMSMKDTGDKLMTEYDIMRLRDTGSEQIIHPPEPKVVYFEGMLSASGVFTEVGYQRGDLSQDQYHILKIACNPVLDGVIPKAAFWLRPTVDTCMERIKKRGREIEDGIQRDYIKALDDAYETYFMKYCKAFPVIEIDNGHINPKETADLIQQFVSVLCE